MREYEGKCDGIYLFGNLSALGFYRKLGFREGVQYRYRLIKRHFIHDDAFFPVNDDPRLLAQYRIAARQSLPCGAFAQLNGWALQMFYTADGDDVYYLPKPDCFVVLSDEKTSLTLKNVVSSRQIPLQELLPYLPGREKEFFSRLYSVRRGCKTLYRRNLRRWGRLPPDVYGRYSLDYRARKTLFPAFIPCIRKIGLCEPA